jgi:hypothetical protein
MQNSDPFEYGLKLIGQSRERETIWFDSERDREKLYNIYATNKMYRTVKRLKRRKK